MKTSALSPRDLTVSASSRSDRSRDPVILKDTAKRKLRFKEFLHLLDKAEAEAESKSALGQPSQFR